MPIEIRELVVRATILDPSEQNDKRSGSPEDDRNDGNDLEFLIEECVKRVMEQLRERNER